MSRDDNTDDAPVSACASRAKGQGCDVLVSLHLNDFDDDAANGLEVLFNDDPDRALAEELQQALIRVTNLRNRGVKKRTDLAVLKFDGAAVLIELGFIVNDRDRNTLLDVEVRKDVCNAIADTLEGKTKAIEKKADKALGPAGLASGYTIPSFALPHVGPDSGVPWDKAKAAAGMNIYSGLVRNSCHVFDSKVPAVYYAAKFAIDGDGAASNLEDDPAFQSDTSLHDAGNKPLQSSAHLLNFPSKQTNTQQTTILWDTKMSGGSGRRKAFENTSPPSPKPDWCDSITLHHTAEPSLAQRPNGLLAQHIRNIQDFYQNTKHWNAGPHLFVDEDQLWGMCDFRKKGVHAVSFNKRAIGIEVLGDYDSESPKSGRGLECWKTAAAATKVLLDWLGLKPSDKTVLFHREDPQTSKTCPGTKVSKEWILGLIGGATEEPADTQHPKPPLDVPIKNADLQFVGERWCTPVRAYLLKTGVAEATVKEKLKKVGSQFYYGEELLEHAYYDKASESTWAPISELDDLV